MRCDVICSSQSAAYDWFHYTFIVTQCKIKEIGEQFVSTLPLLEVYPGYELY